MKKSQKVVTWIVRCVGIGLIIGGAIKLISTSNIDVPHMTDPDWFDIESGRSFGMFSGISMLMIGIFTTILGFSIKGPKGILKQSEENTTETNSIVDFLEKVTGNKESFCDYCGSPIENGKAKCDSCGASKTKK